MIYFLPAVMALVFWFRGGHGLARRTGSQVWKAVYGLLLASPVLILGGGVPLYLATALGAFGAVTLGHGSGLDMGRRPALRDGDEFISIVARKIFRLRPASFAHDFAAMTVSGFLYGLPLFLVSPWAIAACLALGLAKASAYALGWEIHERWNPPLDGGPVAAAELLTGALQGGVLAAFIAAAGAGSG